MSKEQEALQHRTAGTDQPGSNQQPRCETLHVPQTPDMGFGRNPASAVPGYTYNTAITGSPASAVPGYTYNTAMVPGPVSNPVLAPGRDYVNPASKKSVLEAYLLWLILGAVGAHHFYLRRPYFGILYFFTFALGGFGYVIDLFRMPYLVSQANKRSCDPELENKKNISDAYTLWFPFGLLGFHHFYLNRPGFGVLYFCTLGIFGIGWLIDLVRIPYLVKDANSKSGKLQEKSVGTAYALGMSPLGIFGCHHFYLRRPEFGILYFFTFGNAGIGWIVDWFRLPILVKRANKQIAFGTTGERYLDDAYILWIPFGIIGAHHFYLNRPIWGILYFFTFGLAGIGWLIDAFRMPCLVKDCNRLVEERRRLPFRSGEGGREGFIVTTTYMTGTEGYTAPVYNPQQLPPHHQQQQQQQQQQFYPHQQQQQFVYPPAYQYPQQQPVPSYMEQPPPYSVTHGHAQGGVSGDQKV